MEPVLHKLDSILKFVRTFQDQPKNRVVIDADISPVLVATFQINF
ncbi:hypothetical protein KKY_951 [Pelagibacterium halotolerans B2]|uniref:Uncharacterized protein n=1 Tax=Pelagibacterium halotolerans (strain DSM 22347 / JCM 15775 / CGMCC 1.7692 / B2) TaxID=1082931 RepID=G4RFU4_PELHB|nr:hypothetical protein KKY_951 [Pelagibacterium halotolerans B2]